MNENEKKELTNEEVVDHVLKQFSESERKDIIDLYREVNIEPMKDALHKMMVGRASHLVKEMVAKGATNEEMDRALEYLLVCMESQKFSLNIEDCYKARKIEELLDKYDKEFSEIGTP